MRADRLEAAAIALASAYFLFLLAERLLLSLLRRRIRILVHVNGTRGKSETVRLVAAALRAGGYRVLAKTTGTEARLIMPDGSERRLRRLGAANVREQRGLVLRAALAGADAVVAECMAISPEAQAASSAFLAPDILVVTNSRPDHGAELGSPEEAARVFAEGIPAGGSVITADPALLPELEAAALRRAASASLAPSSPDGPAGAVPENAGIALAVAEKAGVPREAALSGMRSYRRDPGSFALRSLRRPGGGAVIVADALSANDPVSTDILLSRAEPYLPALAPRYLLLANRADRPERALAFASWAASLSGRYAGILVAGPLPLGARRALSRGRPGTGAGRPRGIERIAPREALDRLAALPAGSVIHAVGNWKGLGPALAAAAPILTGGDRPRELPGEGGG